MTMRPIAVSAFVVIATTALCSDNRSVWDGVYTATQADRGKGLYMSSCPSCHGENLDGGHIYGSRTRTAPALRGDSFLSGWNGHRLSELFMRIRTSMPLDHPGSLSNEASTDIVAFIMQANGFPAGNSDLPPDTAVMETIQIVPKK